MISKGEAATAQSQQKLTIIKKLKEKMLQEKINSKVIVFSSATETNSDAIDMIKNETNQH